MGVTGSLAANRAAAKADLIIGIGTRYSDFTTSSKWAFQREDVSFLNLNVNGADGAKLGGEALIADAKEGLKELHQELSRVGYQAGYEDRELADLKAAWDCEVDRLYAAEHPDGLSQTRALGVINEVISPSSIIVCAAGSLPGDLHRLWRPSEPKTYHMEYGFSCMGMR